MRRMSVAEAEKALGATVETVERDRDRVTLTRDGKAVAAIVTAEDLAFLEDLEERIDLEEARKALAEGGDPIPFETIRRDLGLD
jgi:PHD/YefM family antitoxin component YafN of YafNO toxin-antitoxin module